MPGSLESFNYLEGHPPRGPEEASLDKLTAGCRVVDAGKLAESASILIADARARERCVTNAQAALSPFRGALERTMVALKPVLRSEGKPGAPLVRLEPAQS